MARKKTNSRRTRAKVSGNRSKLPRKPAKRKKSLPFKKWMQTIKDSETGGRDVEDTKGKSPQRRGGL